ncbi:hypothetical protein [Nonomuraea sediminis]|uniref:hypothetical protein n=1 Tax=Nonomuraea sediminis TaxID=2835864 RepID=UPI001BDCA927|nr:hypothetical protein [Nonomuraea sediminis]
MRRALVVGGTGRLSGVVAERVRDGWYVVTPSRRDASPAATHPNQQDHPLGSRGPYQEDDHQPGSGSEQPKLNTRSTHGGSWVHLGCPGTNAEYAEFSNQYRAHQALDQAAPLRAVPDPIIDPARIVDLDVRRGDRLSGVLHEYSHAA